MVDALAPYIDSARQNAGDNEHLSASPAPIRIRIQLRYSRPRAVLSIITGEHAALALVSDTLDPACVQTLPSFRPLPGVIPSGGPAGVAEFDAREVDAIQDEELLRRIERLCENPLTAEEGIGEDWIPLVPALREACAHWLGGTWRALGLPSDHPSQPPDAGRTIPGATTMLVSQVAAAAGRAPEIAARFSMLQQDAAARRISPALQHPKQSLYARRKNLQVIGVRNGRQWEYPEIQFEVGRPGIRPWVQPLLQRIPWENREWRLLEWMTTPSAHLLDMTPARWLECEKSWEAVVHAAGVDFGTEGVVANPSFRLRAAPRRRFTERLHGAAELKQTVAYVRVRSRDDAEALQGQISRIEAYFRQHEGQVYHLIVDESCSLRCDSEAYRRLTSDVAKGKIGRIVVTHHERLARINNDMLISLCDAKGVGVIVLEHGESPYAERDAGRSAADLIADIRDRFRGSSFGRTQAALSKLARGLAEPPGHGNGGRAVQVG